MLPFFNTSGPCIPGEHYMLPPQRRLDHVLELIESRRFFTLHAGRQTGKTLSWQERLTTRELEHRGKRIHLVTC